MKNLSKHAVILDNLSSPYIHQAIIILKSDPPEKHEKIIEEAEQIVASYFNSELPPANHTEKQKNSGLKAAVAILSTALILTLFLPFFR